MTYKLIISRKFPIRMTSGISFPYYTGRNELPYNQVSVAQQWKFLFSSQVPPHTKAAGPVWAYRPLLWQLHQLQLHPSFVCTGWVWLNWLLLTQAKSEDNKSFIFLSQVSMWPWPLTAGGVNTPASRCLITWWWWCLGTSMGQTRGVVCCDGHSWDMPTYPQFLSSAPSAQEFVSVSQLWST